MRILLISFSTNPDLQQYLYNLYKYYRSENKEVFTLGSNDIKINTIMDKYNYIIKTPERPTINTESFVLFFKNISKIKMIMKRIKPNIVHFISKHVWNYFFIKLFFRYPDIYFLHTIHDPIGHMEEKIRKKVIFYYKTINKIVDGVVFHSYNSFEDYKNNYNLIRKNIIIPLGIFKSKEYQKNRNNKKVIIFGRLNPYKGLEFIPKLSDELLKLDKKIEINIYGKVAPEINKNLIQKIKRKKNIRFYSGFVSEDKVDELFMNHDITLITHKSISQSGIIVKSYLNSRPVIAFNVKGMSEFVNKKTGELVEPFNIKNYANKIYKLLNNKNILDYKSFNAWKYSKSNFNVEIMARNLYHFYSDVFYSNFLSKNTKKMEESSSHIDPRKLDKK
ncbi:glycosyltransferase family 4 protein [Marinitoga sp. 1155]|uniref:glycosyltransferase family 4 protein n=1 Tax=Marinitoga sp. 1155 TaxID=1428448 RepID=UPI000640F925|nr:glycosyltransferase family 4 protein [Marinitoga sp. 1155]KLO22760.1 hypothetical protein X274_07665 [Marinitoga sp. 1155]